MGMLNTATEFFKSIPVVAGWFAESKENKGQRLHKENMADFGRDASVISQFSNEFAGKGNRTKWDSFVDGLNRLPRPLMAISILSFFVLAPMNPERFIKIAKAYELMPPGYWALLSIIIGFYFGGRMQLKSQDFHVRKDAVVAAKELVQIKKQFEEFDTEYESAASKMYKKSVNENNTEVYNVVVKEWLDSKEEKEGA